MKCGHECESWGWEKPRCSLQGTPPPTQPRANIPRGTEHVIRDLGLHLNLLPTLGGNKQTGEWLWPELPRTN